MTANKAENLSSNIKNQSEHIQNVHRSALATCTPLKEKYDNCFHDWYRISFLKNQIGGNRCDDVFDEYRACLIEAVHEKGLSHLELFGPKPPN